MQDREGPVDFAKARGVQGLVALQTQGAHAQIVLDREIGEDIALLRHEADAPFRLTEGLLARDVLPQKGHLARAHGQHAVEAFQQRGLACAVVAEEADDAPLGDGQVDLLQHLEGAMGDVDSARFKHCRRAPDIRG